MIQIVNATVLYLLESPFLGDADKNLSRRTNAK
jgi:hypothetical protein